MNTIVISFLAVTTAAMTTGQILDNNFIIDEEPEVQIYTVYVEAILNYDVLLPCNLSTDNPNNLPSLVLWYQEPSGKPFYSYDSRKNANHHDHWSDDTYLGGRASLSRVPPTGLHIKNVRESDEGIYRCRVDFQESPTQNMKVNLTVIVPPKRPRIVTADGIEVDSVIGPYLEGKDVILICISSFGRPPANVVWYKENALLDKSFEVTGKTGVRNQVVIKNIQREDLNTTFTCHASNNNVTAPESKYVKLDMDLRPLNVQILGTNQPLSANKEYEIVCKSEGSRPIAKITWKKGGERLTDTREITLSQGNGSTSTLRFTPNKHDAAKKLTCMAENTRIPDSEITDSWTLNVYYIPEANLQLGSSLNPNDIKNGDDVYFDCNIESNPAMYKVEWQKDGKELKHNASIGIIMSNQSLVLQEISRKSAGHYACLANNIEGTGISNTLELVVKYAPICKGHQKITYGVARREEGKISCDIEAVPPATHFRWAFNNSGEIDIAQSHFTMEGLRSILSYTPMTELDYGTLVCWAENEIGFMQRPCVYHIIPAGPPDPVSNCSIFNQSEDGIQVRCEEGFNGGLPQSFGMEVINLKNNVLLHNLTESRPYFVLKSLPSGTDLQIFVFSINAKGRSERVILQTTTLKVAEKRTAGDPIRFQLTPILGILIGIVAALVILAVIIVIIMKFRSYGKEHKSNGTLDVPLKKALDESYDVEEKNPDLIPQNNENSYTDLKLREDNALYSSSDVYQHARSTVYNVLQQVEDVQYAELGLSRDKNNSIMRNQTPTIYAEIDHTKHPLLGVRDQPPHLEDGASNTPLMRSTNQRESTV